MTKSEHGLEPLVAKHSHFLGEELRKSGHDIFSVQIGNAVEFQITKYNTTLASANGFIDSDNLSIDSLSIPKEFSKALAGATVEKAMECKVGLKLRK
jgi:hypothetical protein